ncbi:hypothetical protein AB6A40_000217 [Gnathostoma spinigerum]|uniref:Uncharacterized protein n=1 Tax=Gnathostoma spinigerum TaxID=75299 RepID=A0ABD6E1P7_9BILA
MSARPSRVESIALIYSQMNTKWSTRRDTNVTTLEMDHNLAILELISWNYCQEEKNARGYMKNQE